MAAGTILLYVIVALVVIIALWIIALYNGLVRLNIRCNEAMSDIDVQTKRRYDLITNLVETVKGYASHEKGLLENVTKARAEAMGAKGVAERAAKENMLSETLKSLFAVAENYPDLKANQNFAQLQDELANTENKIESSRRYYNANVRDFNIKIHVFPNTLFAESLGFKEDRPLFEAIEAEKENVKVDFSA